MKIQILKAIPLELLYINSRDDDDGYQYNKILKSNSPTSLNIHNNDMVQFTSRVSIWIPCLGQKFCYLKWVKKYYEIEVNCSIQKYILNTILCIKRTLAYFKKTSS